jgi:hypothetical protein
LERSNDTTESSNITVIEGHGPEEDIVVVEDEVCDKNSIVDCDEHKVESDESCAKLQQRANEDDNNNKDDATTFNFPPSTTTNGGLPSCLLRRDSSRASIKKKVRCSETAEIIPASDYFINNEVLNVTEDDEDDVFSDSAPAQVPRGNMCSPYVPRKGSLPIPEALPDWFPSSRLLHFLDMRL